jgi:predicted dehydrogenase
MKFALLGTDADSLELARAIVASDHTLSAVCEPDPKTPGVIEELRRIEPRLRLVDSWEAVLDSSIAEAVIVARGADEDARAEQLRKLVQAGTPMIVGHPVVDSMLIYYELDMIRQESQAILLPRAPDRWHPAVQRLVDLTKAGAADGLGQVEQVAMERFLSDRGRQNVLAHFARDVELVRRLCGEMTKIGAMSSLGDQVDYANLGVQMSGPSGMIARWTVMPIDDHAPQGANQEHARLVVIGGQGKATLSIPAEDEPWSLELRRAGKTTLETYPEWDPAEETLLRFEEALAGGDVHPNWIDASRDMELTDALERSVKRGRTIDLHYEEHTEQGTFKGMMAATGCALLIGALVLVIIATTAVNLNVPLAGAWPYLLLGVLVIFLLLQPLKLVFPDERSKS